MRKKSDPHVDHNFHQHATRAVALICIGLGLLSVVIPIIYGVNPWTGVVFTLISIWVYRQATYRRYYRHAAITLTGLLACASVAYAAIHGVYGALAFFLIMLSGVVASVTLSMRTGIIVFALQTLITLPLALYQYQSKAVRYQETPVLPDTLMAVAVAAMFYLLLRMFSGQLTLMKGREVAHLKELAVYNDQMESVLQTRLEELESTISKRTSQLRHLAQRGKELHNLSHDVSNTLTSLRLLIDQHLSTVPAPDRERIESNFEYLRTILQNANHRSTSESPETNVASVVAECEKIVSKNVRQHGIQLSLKLEPATVRMRPDHMQRILINLLGNAMDALQEISRRKRVILIEGKRQGSMYLLKVRDNGLGIPETLRPLVEEPWFSTKGSQHMGMGLASIKELVALYPGTEFTLDSKAGQYTVATLTLPL